MKLTRRITIAALPLAALGLIAGCASGSGSSGSAASSSGLPTTKATKAAPVTTPSAAPTPNPQANLNESCAYTLGGGINSPSYLTGEIDVRNTGNVGIVVRARVSWPQEGFAPITQYKTARVPIGQTVAVRFNVNAGSVSSNSNIITNLQNWETGHNFPSNDCTYKGKIISTYGAVQNNG